MRAVLVLLGAAVVAAVLLQEPRDATRLCLGLLAALLPFSLAALLEQARFDFDASQRRLRWRRASWLRSRSGELAFGEITDAEVRTRLETDLDATPRWTYPVYRVVLSTRSGELPLCNAWTGEREGSARVAEAIRTALGLAPGRGAPAALADVELGDLLAAGSEIDAILLVRRRLGLGLAEAKRLVDDVLAARGGKPPA